MENNTLPWTEKHRPSSFDELIVDDILKKRLTSYNVDNFNHLLLSGNPGIGKTTTALLIIKNIVSSKYSYIELNASDNRGIKMILTLVNIFCKRKTNDKIKIILLDEADNITSKAQQQLIGLIEAFPKVKFILTCNNSIDIIEGLQSRMTLIKFSKPSLQNITNYMKQILVKENIADYTNEGLNDIVLVTDYDFRSALNYLEAMCRVGVSISSQTFQKYFNLIYIDYLKYLSKNIFNINIPIESIIDKFVDLNSLGNPNNDTLISIIFLIENHKEYNIDITFNLAYNVINLIYVYYFKIIETNDSNLLIISLLYKIRELASRYNIE